MILRRIAEHVKTQNWTAVALDFVIVVMGVFVGLQVSNWNDARANRSIAAGHLSEIATDMRNHLEFHDNLYGSAVARIGAVDYIYKAAFARELPREVRLSTRSFSAPETPQIEVDDLNNLMGAVNLVRVTVSSRTGYESLISSGHLGLIENRDLARRIQQYYGGYDDLLDTGKVFRTFRNDAVSANYRLGLSVFDERPPAEIIDLARTDESFAAYLRSTREWAIIHAGLLDQLRIDTEALLAEVDAEIKMLG